MGFLLLLLLLDSTIIFMDATYLDKNWNNESFIESLQVSLPDNVVPKHYTIQLELAVEEDIFHGTAKISIIINNPTRVIYLHAEELNIFTSKLTLDQDDIIPERAYVFSYYILDYYYIESKQCIGLAFGSPVPPGNYTLNMEFKGIIDNNVGGFFKTSHINEKGDRESVVAMHTWPIGARRVFPCWDEPKFKAEFTITIKHHANYTALSNMPMLSSGDENNITTTCFATTPEIPTYLIAIVLCQFSRIALGNIDWWSRQQLISNRRFAQSVIENFNRYFENEWKQLRKFPIVKHVAIPNLLDNDVAMWGLVFYRDEDIIYNEEFDPIAHKIKMEYLIGRKISRQWLSTVVSPLWWSYLWLNEGIATFFYVADVINKDMSNLFVVQTLQESLHLDVQSIMNPLTSEVKNITDIESLCSFSYYTKGFAIMRMLQHILSDKVFRNGIDAYLKRRSASLDDFWADMQAALFIYNKESPAEAKNFHIRDVMDDWTKQTNYPVLMVLLYDRYCQIHVLSQMALEDWKLPVTYTTQTNLNFNNTSPLIWLYPEATHKIIALSSSSEVDDWIIFNLQQTGYYRVKYNEENWLKIARYLNSEKYTKIHVLNRAQIVDDAFHFAIAGQLNSSIFWKLVNYLSQETSYTAWYPMIKAIEYMSCIFPFIENTHYKEMIRSKLNPVLRKIGYEESSYDNHFTACLRQEAAKWACILGDSDCKREAVAKLEWHLEYPIQNKLLPWWRKWTYCNGLSATDDSTLKTLLNNFLEERDMEKLGFLACSNEYFHIVIRNFIAVMESRSKNEYLSKVYIILFHYLVERHARKTSVLDYVLANWNDVKPKEISTTVALIDIINHVYSVEQLNKITKFIKDVEAEPFDVSFNHKFLDLEVLSEKKKIHRQINDGFIKILTSNMDNKVNTRLFEINRHMDSYITVFT